MVYVYNKDITTIREVQMRLTEERERRKWSRAELARRSGMNAGTVGLIESRRLQPYPKQLEKIAEALEWPIEDSESLLDDDSEARQCTLKP